MAKKDKSLKSFLLLSNLYYEKLLQGSTISQLVVELEMQSFIYLFNKEAKADDLIDKTGYILCDNDIEDNYYALAYAVSKYFNTYKTDNKIIDKYILKMRNENNMIK